MVIWKNTAYIFKVKNKFEDQFLLKNSKVTTVNFIVNLNLTVTVNLNLTVSILFFDRRLSYKGWILYPYRAKYSYYIDSVALTFCKYQLTAFQKMKASNLNGLNSHR